MNTIRIIEKIQTVTNLRGITKVLTNWLRFIALFVNHLSYVTERRVRFEKCPIPCEEVNTIRLAIYQGCNNQCETTHR